MKRLATPLAILAVVGTWAFLQMAYSPALTYSNGSPGGYTASTGDGTNSCAQSGCHDDANHKFTSGLGDIDLSNIPSNGYVPGKTYTITTSISKAGYNNFGFELSSEKDGGSVKVGSFASNGGETQSKNNKDAITHTSSGNTGPGGSKSWTMDWTAPPAGTGQVKFQAAFNVANGNGQPTGDTIHIASTTIDEDANTAVAPSAKMLGQAGIKVFPTPASEQLTISGMGGELSSERVLLRDLQGRIVQELHQGELNGAEASFALDAGLNSGTYLLELQGKDRRLVERVLIE